VYLPNLIASIPQVIVLDTSTSPFQWSIPKVGSNDGIKPPSLVFHTANLYENYMIIAYGKFKYLHE
jgi:hypothetical protein